MKARLCGVMLTALAVAASAASAQQRREVPIYDSTEIALDRYVVVKRLGVQDWRSGFFIPSYADVNSAKLALATEAVRIGADGLINLHCVGQSDRISRAGHYCYANAIKIKRP